MGKFSITLTWVFSGLFLITGVILWHWPHRSFELPENRSLDTPVETRKELNTNPIISLTNRFDHTNLPQPIAPPKPARVIDPIAELKGWTLTGVVQSDDKSMALFARGNTNVMREVDDALAGFTLVEITSRQVVFRHETITHHMSLPFAPEQKISLNRQER